MPRGKRKEINIKLPKAKPGRKPSVANAIAVENKIVKKPSSVILPKVKAGNSIEKLTLKIEQLRKIVIYIAVAQAVTIVLLIKVL